ncbi:emp24/gp25L/p24 family/GOLD-domain-containing protein [Limtongia smithiae]|uniref:emp24/gp25L/p24 family/GOLD-domain-containing protein n=1 Tax=Limtongia smithiae TaxID=1125753 RepID=UPI0034CFEE36
MRRFRISSGLATLLVVFTVLSAAPAAQALKLAVTAQTHAHVVPRCIRNFVTREVLVVVNIKTDGRKGDGQVLNVAITDLEGNEYARPKDVVGDSRVAFTSHSDGAFDVCFENILQPPHTSGLSREIDLDIDIGADARDWNAVGQTEKLMPMELELRRIEETVDEISRQMEYLRAREQRMRDTNESTNARVKFFAIGTLFCLFGLSVWQLAYLRQYFRSKHLI